MYVDQNMGSRNMNNRWWPIETIEASVAFIDMRIYSHKRKESPDTDWLLNKYFDIAGKGRS